MKFILYSPVHFEEWDWRNSIEQGIGGSETCHVELAWRLAKRGHEVISYAPTPPDCSGSWLNTKWLPLEKADFSENGIWLIYRDASCLDHFQKLPEQQVWLVSQDEVPIGITAERIEKIDVVLAYCAAHKNSMEKIYPELSGKIKVSSNGLKMDLIREVEKENIVRQPHRLMYASSPDRGLLSLLKIFRRTREFIPDLELHCFYGTNNIEKLIKYNEKFTHYKNFLEDLHKEIDQPGVFWHGRISQRELYREWLRSTLWVYPTHFTETSCITAMECQALGAVPITRPLWALAENVMCGTFIEGDPRHDELSRARYVGEIIRWLNNTEMQEMVRKPMMRMARDRFNWERVVDQLEAWLYGWTGMNVAQFNFQLKHAYGRVLNIGCADDPAEFGNKGDNVNLDIATEIPWTNVSTKASVIHDAREPLPFSNEFDTVVLGDILEHLTDADIKKVLTNSKKVLVPGGRIVITCPDDHRPTNEQHARNDLLYPVSESAYHERRISKEMLLGWLREVGLQSVVVQEIDYTHFTGYGIMAMM